MKILFTSPIIEHPAAGGPQLRIENTIKALAQTSELFVISRANKEALGGNASEVFYRDFCKKFVYAPSAKKWVSGNRYLRKAQSILRNVGGRSINADARFIINFIKQNNIEILWVGFGNISFPLIKKIKELQPNLKLVCDTDSVWSRFVLRELPYIKNPFRYKLIENRGRKKEAEEKAWVELCDITTAVSEVDADYYRSLCKHSDKIFLFSNVIDIASYRNVPPPPEKFHRPCMYLAGTFGHHNSPMDTAARWVLEEVFPKIKQQIPSIHFYLVGRDSDKMFGHISDPSITVTGKLPSVLPYLCNSDVSIVPLKFESGTRFKILEAAACGIPIVSTTLGAEGIPVENSKNILLADTSEAFAASIVKIISDKALAESLTKNCLALVKERYSVEFLAGEAKTIIARLTA